MPNPGLTELIPMVQYQVIQRGHTLGFPARSLDPCPYLGRKPNWWPGIVPATNHVVANLDLLPVDPLLRLRRAGVYGPMRDSLTTKKLIDLFSSLYRSSGPNGYF